MKHAKLDSKFIKFRNKRSYITSIRRKNAAIDLRYHTTNVGIMA